MKSNIKSYLNNLVSVIIPAYNVEKFIGRCLDNILKQSYPNIEIIVVYDNSPDNTLNVLKKYVDNIKLIKVGRKTSPAIARNIGLAHAKGEFIAFCDADDFFAPEKIERQVTVLDDDLAVGLVYTDYILVDSSGKEIKCIQVPDWNRQKWFSNKFNISTSSVLLRREILDDVAENGYYFDETLVACEDFDLLIRLAKITEFARVPFFLASYTLREGQLSKDILKTIIMETKILIKQGLYSSIIPMTSFELAKMILTKIFKNPMIGFGLFFKEKYTKKTNSYLRSQTHSE